MYYPTVNALVVPQPLPPPYTLCPGAAKVRVLGILAELQCRLAVNLNSHCSDQPTAFRKH